eukprot:273934_1
MRSLVMIVTAVAAVLLLQAPTADAVCTLTGEAGQRIADYNDTNGIPSCRAGYYCPDFDSANTSTYPEACLAHPVCAAKRLFGEQCDEPQGTFEPVVCPSGSYCPYNKGTIIKCASDVMCGVGSVEPEACPALSFCNGKKAQNFGNLVYFLLLSIA